MMRFAAGLSEDLEGGVNALEGLRVVDFSTGVAGASCTKLFADYGADVIKVEPTGGDPLRRVPPFAGDIPDPERGLLFLSLNTNKRSVSLNLETEDGLTLARSLAATADIVVESDEPGAMAEIGLGYEDLCETRPGVVYASITPWGQDGPYVDLGFRASELTLQGMGGPVIQTGSADREPLKLGGNVAQIQAGTVAAYAVMLAVLRAEAGGEGDHIDVSIYETQAGSRDRRTIGLTTYAYQGTISGRRTLSGYALASGVQPCLDGEVDILAPGPKIHDFVRMIGREDLAGDPRLNQPPPTLDPAFVQEIATAYLGWSMQRTKRDAVAEAQSYGLLAGIINTTDDLITDPHYRDRGVWETVEHPVAGTFEYPGRTLLLSDTPRPPAHRAPLFGEHTAEVLAELGVPRERLVTLRGVGAI